MELFDALDAAHASLHRAFVSVDQDAWSRPSPCEGWTVRDVAQHIAGGAVRYQLLLQGFGEAEIAPTRTEDQLGDDPVASNRTRVAALMAVVPQADLEAPVQHPSGVRTGRELLNLRIMEATVHAWDINVGAGADPLLDADLCAYVIAHFDDMGSTVGFFGPRPAAGWTDPRQVVLGYTGRVPRR